MQEKSPRIRPKKKWFPLLLCLLCSLALFSLSACAAQSPSAAPAYVDSAMPQSEPARAPWSGVADADAEESGVGLDDFEQERRIVSTARLELVVEDTARMAEQIGEIAAENRGYVGSANLYKASYDASDALRGTIMLRVPAETLDAVIAQLEALALDVRSKSTDRQDVTDQYADIEAQLRTLTATETELLALLAEVRARENATADEIMAVYVRLTEIRTEIERLQGRLNLLDNRIRLSTLEVTLVPDPGSRPVVQAGWQPGNEARAAIRTLVSATQGLVNLLIWAALFVLPLLLLAIIPLAIAFFGLRLLVRRFGRSKRIAPGNP